MLKKIAIGVVVLLVVIAGGAYYLFSNLDSIIKAAIEKYGTAATQAEVKLDSVKLSIASGEGALDGLTVGNPKGFTTPRALNLGSIAVKLDTSSVTGNGPIVIKEIDIEKPQVTYEVTSNGDSNLQTIQRNAMAYGGASGGGGGNASAGGGGTGNAGGGGNGNTGGGGQERKLVITDLYIRDGEVGITHALLKGKTLSAPLPTIHLSNIGKDKGGATPGQVAEQVLGSITASASKVASVDLQKELGSLKDVVGSGAGSLKDAAGSGGAGISDQVKGLLGK
jgi:hypothetical protein